MICLRTDVGSNLGCPPYKHCTLQESFHLSEPQLSHPICDLGLVGNRKILWLKSTVYSLLRLQWAQYRKFTPNYTLLKYLLKAVYPDSKSWDLNFPGLSQFQILCPNFPHKPLKCLKNSTLSVPKQHLPDLLLHKKAAQTFFFRRQLPIFASESVVSGALQAT